jgi:hypothetical protein
VVSIRDYPDVRCGAVGHLWEDYQPLRKTRLGSQLTFRCAYCGKQRYDVVSRATGELVTRSYSKLPQIGYRKLGFDKNDVRKEFVRRMSTDGRVRKVRTGKGSKRVA